MGCFRKNWNKIVDGIQQTRSIYSAKNDDLVFRCKCGTERIYGKKGVIPNSPVFINCWNARVHGTAPKLTMHTWVHDFIPEIQKGAYN